MLKYIYNSYKTQLHNFGYLSAVNVFNLIFPLITYPYLVRVLGASNYGLVVFALSFIAYLQIFVAFGFNTIAVKHISVNRKDPQVLSRVLFSVVSIKLMIFMFLLILFFAVLPFISFFKNNIKLYFCCFVFLFNEVVNPVWFFQGVEKMKYITWLSFFSKLLYLISIFLFINASSDYYLVPFLNGMTAVLINIYAIFLVYRKFEIHFFLPRLSDMKYYLLDSKEVFLSNLFIKLYNNSTRFICGLFFTMSEVAYVDLAEKIVNLIKMPVQVVGETLYPKFSFEKNNFVKRKFLYIVLFIALVLFGCVFLLSNQIVSLLGGEDLTPASQLIKILIFSIFPVSLSLFFANLTLLTEGYNIEYLRIRLYSFLFYVISLLIIFLFKMITLENLIGTVVFTEVSAAIISYIYLRKLKLNF